LLLQGSKTFFVFNGVALPLVCFFAPFFVPPQADTFLTLEAVF
jgi:hypothetical protein